MNQPAMSERMFWNTVRRALLMVCDAIDKRYLRPTSQPSLIEYKANEATPPPKYEGED